MKKVLVILIVGVVLFGACSAQRTEAQSSNNAQKIIGTWVTAKGQTWVFNANGTLAITYSDGRTDSNTFGVTDTKLAINDSDNNLEIYEISISSDGKTLILVIIGNNSRHSYATSYSYSVWLNKK